MRRYRVDRYGEVIRSLDADAIEREELIPTELRGALASLLDVIGDLVQEAYASPYGQPDSSETVRVQSGSASHSNLLTTTNREFHQFLTGKLVGLVLDVRAECAHVRAGAPRGPYQRRRRRSA